MKNSIYLLFVLFVLFTLINPFYLNEFMNSLVGKLVCIVLIIYFSLQNKFSGLLVAFAFICFIETLQTKEEFSIFPTGVKPPAGLSATQKHDIHEQTQAIQAKAKANAKIAKEKSQAEAAKVKAQAPILEAKAKAKSQADWAATKAGVKAAPGKIKAAAVEAAAQQKALTAYIKKIYNKQYETSYLQDLSDEAKKRAIQVSRKQAKLQTTASLI
jgi:hypothetical protein